MNSGSAPIAETCNFLTDIVNSKFFDDFEKKFNRIEFVIQKSENELMSSELSPGDASKFLINFFHIHAYLFLWKNKVELLEANWERIQNLFSNVQPIVFNCLNSLNNHEKVIAYITKEDKASQVSFSKNILCIHYYIFDYVKHERMVAFLSKYPDFPLQLNEGLLSSAQICLEKHQIPPTSKKGHEFFCRDYLSSDEHLGFLKAPQNCPKTGYELDCVSRNFPSLLIEVDGTIFHKDVYKLDDKDSVERVNVRHAFKRLILRNAGYTVGSIESTSMDFEQGMYSKSAQVARLIKFPLFQEALKCNDLIVCLKSELKSLFIKHHKTWTKDFKVKVLQNLAELTQITEVKWLERLIKESYKPSKNETLQLLGKLMLLSCQIETLNKDIAIQQQKLERKSIDTSSGIRKLNEMSTQLDKLQQLLKDNSAILDKTVMPKGLINQTKSVLEEAGEEMNQVAELEDNIINNPIDTEKQKLIEEIMLERAKTVYRANRTLQAYEQKNAQEGFKEDVTLIQSFLQNDFILAKKFNKMNEVQADIHSRLLKLAEDSSCLKMELQSALCDQLDFVNQLKSFHGNLAEVRAQRELLKTQINQQDATIKALQQGAQNLGNALDADSLSKLQEILKEATAKREAVFAKLLEINKPYDFLCGKTKEMALEQLDKDDCIKILMEKEALACAELKELTQPTCVMAALDRLSFSIPQATPKAGFLPLFHAVNTTVPTQNLVTAQEEQPESVQKKHRVDHTNP